MLAYEPLTSVSESIRLMGSATLFPAGDLILFVAVLTVVALSGWRAPGMRW